MRTSLNEIKKIEEHLFKLQAAEDELLFQASLILDPVLKEKVLWQHEVYELIKEYGRRKLKQEIESVHQKLFNSNEHESFRKKIVRLFSKF